MLRVVYLAILLILGVLPASAQDRNESGIPLEVLNDRLRIEGNAVTFCLNGASTLVEFERAVAEELATALLLEADFHELQSPARPFPYDFRLHLSGPELYVEMTNICDALVGFILSPVDFPQWLTITRPYYTSRFVLAAADPDLTSLSDLPNGAAIGTRLGSSGDVALVTYRGAQTQEPGWLRRPYGDNEVLIDALLDGSAEAILVWEPALYRATEGDPASRGITVIPSSFRSPEMAFGIVVSSDDVYLRDLLDQAIEQAVRTGLIDQLRQEHELP